MSASTPKKDFRTQGIVLRRTNYGEADRILNVITPSGKIVAIAKGSRKEKSKLAGSIEMFSLIDFNLHQGKSEFAIVTGAKMLESYHSILKDYSRMELASSLIKKINQISENSDSPKYFDILSQSLSALNNNLDSNLIDIWFRFNVVKASGEEINLYRDTNSEILNPDQKYSWDYQEKSLAPNPSGNISTDEIKLMRLMVTSKLTTITKIKSIGELIPPILPIAQSL